MPASCASIGKPCVEPSPRGWSHRNTKLGRRDRGSPTRSSLYLKERLAAYPGLTAARLWREAKERGYAGGYSVLRDCVRDLRPPRTADFEVRFETPPGEQAQVDFAHFEVEFADERGVKRIVVFIEVFAFPIRNITPVLRLDAFTSGAGKSIEHRIARKILRRHGQD